MIRPPSRRWLALAGSLLLHGGVLGGLALTLAPWHASPPTPALEVEFRAEPPAAAPVAASSRLLPEPATPTPQRVARRLVEPPPAADSVTAKDTEPATAEDADAIDAAAAVASADSRVETAASGEAAVPPRDAAEPESRASAAADAAALPAIALPARLELGYEVRYGVASGRQSLLWVNEGEHYTLSSVAEASGLAGIFYRGRFVQLSRGRLTQEGLKPEEFWDQRGNKRSSARFSAGAVTLVPATGTPRHFGYSGTAQDALSLFFQLALDAPAGRELSFTVFNGKKLRAYRYAARGEVLLETALGPLRTLHLERVGAVDGRFEAWLAIDRHYLPVRLLRHDEDGNAVELRLQTIAP